MKNMKKLILMAAFGLFVHQNIGATDTPVDITVVGAPAGYIVQYRKCINNGCTTASNPSTISPTVTGGSIYSIDTSAEDKVQYFITLNGKPLSNFYKGKSFENQATWTLTASSASTTGYTDVLSSMINITVAGAPTNYSVQTKKCQRILHNGLCEQWETPAPVSPVAGNTYSINTSLGNDYEYIIMAPIANTTPIALAEVASVDPSHFVGKTTWTLTPEPEHYASTLT